MENYKEQVLDLIGSELMQIGYSEHTIESTKSGIDEVVDVVFKIIDKLELQLLPKNIKAGAGHTVDLQNVIASNIFKVAENGEEVSIELGDIAVNQILYHLGKQGWLIIPPH